MEILQCVLLFMILGMVLWLYLCGSLHMPRYIYTYGCAYKVDGHGSDCNYTDAYNVSKIIHCNTSCCSDTDTDNQSVCCATKEEDGGSYAWIAGPVIVSFFIIVCLFCKIKERIERERKEKEEKRNKTTTVPSLQMPYKQEPWLQNEGEITWANQFPSNSPTVPPRIPPPSYMDATRGAEGGAPTNQNYGTPIFVVPSDPHPPPAYEYIPPKT